MVSLLLFYSLLVSWKPNTADCLQERRCYADHQSLRIECFSPQIGQWPKLTWYRPCFIALFQGSNAALAMPARARGEACHLQWSSQRLTCGILGRWLSWRIYHKQVQVGAIYVERDKKHPVYIQIFPAPVKRRSTMPPCWPPKRMLKSFFCTPSKGYRRAMRDVSAASSGRRDGRTLSIKIDRMPKAHFSAKSLPAIWFARLLANFAENRASPMMSAALPNMLPCRVIGDPPWHNAISNRPAPAPQEFIIPGPAAIKKKEGNYDCRHFEGD